MTPTTVYAATYDQRDPQEHRRNADLERDATPGPAGVVVEAIAVDPSAPSVVYAGSGRRRLEEHRRRRERGIPRAPASAVRTWRRSPSDPATTTTLYAGSVASGVFKSTDGAGSWSPANTGLEGDGTSASSRSIRRPRRPSTPATNGGVFKSVDGAATWNPASAGLSGDGLIIRDIAIDPVDADDPLRRDSGGRRPQHRRGRQLGKSPRTVGGRGPSRWTRSRRARCTPPSSPSASPRSRRARRAAPPGLRMNDGMFAVPVRLAIAPSGPTRLYVGSKDGGVFAFHDCGNGTPEAFEDCDDGNVAAGDGCSATCTLEPCSTAPVPLCGLAGQAKMQLSEKTPGKEKMKIQWKKLAGSSSPATFGDPIGGSTQGHGVRLRRRQGARGRGTRWTAPATSARGSPAGRRRGRAASATRTSSRPRTASPPPASKGAHPGRDKRRPPAPTTRPRGRRRCRPASWRRSRATRRRRCSSHTSDGFCIGATMTRDDQGRGRPVQGAEEVVPRSSGRRRPRGIAGEVAASVLRPSPHDREAPRSRYDLDMNTARAVNIEDLRRGARRRLPRAVFDYIDGGAERERDARAQYSAPLTTSSFVRAAPWRCRSTTCGRPCSARRSRCRSSSRRSAARGCSIRAAKRSRRASRVDSAPIYTLSTLSGCLLEDVREATSGPAWYQLYLVGGHDVARASIERARRAGYSALVVTIDTPVAGMRERDLRNGMKELCHAESLEDAAVPSCSSP